jgi:hypothetical protein
MQVKVKMPRVGETVDEVFVVNWNKAPGDQVAVGESLLEVETDKYELLPDDTLNIVPVKLTDDVTDPVAI